MKGKTSSSERLPVGTRVKCTKHQGRHTGTIARVIAPNQMYVVGWHGKGTGTVRIGNTDVHYPLEIIENHMFDLTACEADKIEPM